MEETGRYVYKITDTKRDEMRKAIAHAITSPDILPWAKQILISVHADLNLLSPEAQF